MKMYTKRYLTWNDALKYILLYCCFFIYSVSAICAKLAAGQETAVWMLFFIGLEVLCLGGYALIWQQVLKKFTLFTAMANKGIVVIFNLAWSAMLFREMVTIYNIIGAAVIIGGIWMVSSDG